MKNRESLAGVVYYVTGDVENGKRAHNEAAAHDLRLVVRFPKKVPPPPDTAVLGVDLDYLGLDAHGRRQCLAGLIADLRRTLKFVHSYDIDDEEGPRAKNVLLAPQALRAHRDTLNVECGQQ
jgi:hypothetical protein